MANCRIARQAGAIVKILKKPLQFQYSKLLSREYLFPSLVVELVVLESTLGVPLRRVSHCPGTDVNPCAFLNDPRSVRRSMFEQE
jgi:hypothetical protein